MNVASLALMAAVVAHLARDAVTDATAALLAIVGGVALVRYRLNSAWLILAGAAIGLSGGAFLR